MQRRALYLRRFSLVAISAITLFCAWLISTSDPDSGARAGQQGENGAIRLIVRSDDIGAAHGMNIGCIESCTKGIARSVEVIVPGPWFEGATRLLREHPDIDVGVHLTLTSEWEDVKWGPVAKDVPSLTDGQGNFFPMTSQRQGFPPGTGFLECGWKLEEVERELRAQIELARAKISAVTHMTAHMGTATSHPRLRELVDRLAAEYGLPVQLGGVKRVRGVFGSKKTAAQKEASLVRALEELEPGLWLLVEHPAIDSPEMHAIGHEGYENVGEDRAGVLRALTSRKAQNVIRRRGIELVSYGDVLRERSTSAPK